ncbi:MAG: hypothetical protein WCF84_16005 [Anaerolineae bacterium]
MQNALIHNPIDEMEHWGYHLLEQVHSYSPGYTGLMVAIRSMPTRQHYDPEMVRLSLLTLPGQVEEATLNLFTRLDGLRPVCAGLIVLTDRKNKQESFFSFGATVESTIAPGEVIYIVRSTAPILWLTKGGETVADQLAAEFGRLIAEMRALSHKSDPDFFARLAAVEPLALYTAGIASILADYERVVELRESYPDLHTLLHDEKSWLTERGLWMENPTTLAELLGVEGVTVPAASGLGIGT